MTNSSPLLSAEQTAMLQEIANLTGGSASSTLTMLIDPGLELSNPEVDELPSISDLANGSPVSYVMTTLHLQEGFESPVAYLMEAPTALMLAHTMMGGQGEPEGEITDIQLSAVGEAISQMMGAAANSLSQFLSSSVEMTPPQVTPFDLHELITQLPEFEEDAVILIKYRLSGSQTIPDSEFIQVMPLNRVHHLLEMAQSMTPQDPSANPLEARQEVSVGAPAGGGYSQQTSSANPVTVQPVEFPSFDQHVPAYGPLNKNLELVMDVCLNLTVELGRTELAIKDVLELTRGSVIELNRVAGESVDLYANGKMIAKGEVVVIEDNFGLRITSIVSPAERLRGL